MGVLEARSVVPTTVYVLFFVANLVLDCVRLCLDIGIGIFLGIGAFQIGHMRKVYKKTLDIADNVLQKTGIGKSVDDYDFERLMHLDICMRVHLKGHDDYELKLVANPFRWNR